MLEKYIKSLVLKLSGREAKLLDDLNEKAALTKEFLLERGRCCYNNCENCPWAEDKKNGQDSRVLQKQEKTQH